MSKEIYISSTPHETRLAIVENDALAEIYYERENEYTLAGSIYNGRVTRVLPGMQSSFVEIGLERDAFLYITDFMEEAGDTADFEATHGGSGESRGPRPEGQRGDRNGRGDRGDRPAPLTIEASAIAPAESSDEVRPERGDQNGRGERSGRGRNRRGRGNRNGNAERTPNQERSAGTDLPRPVEADLPAAPSFNPPNPAEVGEGAPGADGSRRWRGRRGRRRGRSGAGQPGDSPREAITPAAPGEAEFSDYSIEVESTPEAEEIFEAATPFEAAPAREVYTGEDEPSRSAPPRDGFRDDRGRRDGGRGGRNDRGGRSGRGDRPERTPRGFTPSPSLYGVDAEAGSAESPAEPIILPGESLSKYRRSSEAESGATQTSAPAAGLPANVILAKPTTVVDDSFVASAWDGGLVLPGETLSRRSRPDSRSEARSFRAEAESSRSNFRAPAPVAQSPQQPAVVSDAQGLSVQLVQEEQPEVARSAQLEQVPENEILHETASVPAVLDPIAAVPEPGSPEPEAEEAAAPHVETEYEPSEASASYRIDPVAPSEFRQSAPVLEPVIEPVAEEAAIEEPPAVATEHYAEHPHQEPSVHVDHSHPFNRLDEADTEIEPSGLVAETEEVSASVPQPEIPTETVAYHEPALHLDTTGVPPPPPPVFGHVETVEPSDITSISATGEMHSEHTIVLPVPEALLDPTSPIEHETSIVNPQAQTYIPQTFAPGSGQLEEELIDDEEHETTALHAHYDEEFDDLEEETLEGAADLGTMLREMSIDQITRPAEAEGETEEDDEFEEEEAEGSDYAEDADEGFAEGDKPTHQSAADAEFFANTFREPSNESGGESQRSDSDRRPRREGGRRDGRRDGRDRDRNRSRSTGGESDRSRSGHGGGGQRRSMQATNLPAISDLLKPGQEILVQIAKEPIAKKGARITSHIALPGRFLVFMPTVSHTGVSRKIESDAERRRLKEILLSEKGDAAGGFIVRTAAAGASEDELRSDLRFLLNLWADIKQRSESSKSPALIYHDLNLVERILRDQVTDNFSAIWVDTESEYERVLRFLQRFQPQLIRRVKLYTKETPLFEQFGITEEINKALRSKVWLKSGGSIVINQTEALVAIDINTGKFVGKTARLEDTIVKTNLDAIPEIVRQIRLRDLGGIIIIDFIDMDERKNRNKVMAALEEELKSDRAPSKVLQFNDFGLVAITRKRVKQSLERTLSTTCGVCQGTGMVKSPITVCNDIYIEMRKMHKHLERGDVMLRVHPDVVKQLKSGTSKWLQEMEEMVGKTILVKSDPSLHPEQFDIH
jgi:ribonuclease G